MYVILLTVQEWKTYLLSEPKQNLISGCDGIVKKQMSVLCKFCIHINIIKMRHIKTHMSLNYSLTGLAVILNLFLSRMKANIKYD